MNGVLLLFGIFCVLACCDATDIKPQIDSEKLENDLIQYMQTGNKPESFDQNFEYFENMQGADKSKKKCIFCVILSKAIIKARRLGASRKFIQKVLVRACVSGKFATKDVCYGAIDINMPVLLYIIDKKRDLKGDRVCSIVLQNIGCKSSAIGTWEIEIPKKKVELYHRKTSNTSLQILQLSDLHFDNLYTPKGNANCGKPLCCQSDQGAPTDAAAACGYWGDFRNSDAPLHAIENALDEIKKHKNLDYVYFTGDIVSHRVWSTTVKGNKQDMRKIFGLLKEKLHVPVYPILGNHEPHPLNVWSPHSVPQSEDISTQWVFDLVAEEWSHWLPPDTKETILKGGYYTVLVKPGFRIIGLNTNVCYILNWYLIYDDRDPFEQLQWLVKVLKQAELNSEFVHILGHITTSDTDCFRTWSQQYRRIVERFAATITGQFSGHTHDDTFSLYYKFSRPTEAFSAVFNGASVVTYTNRNPSFKVYYVSEGTFEIQDYDEWTYNLTEANLTPNFPPRWFKLYSFKKAYGVDSLYPPVLNRLVERLARDKSLLNQYFRFMVRNADTAIRNGCNNDCHKENLCTMVTSSFGDDTRCKSLKQIYDQANSLVSA